MTNIGIVHPEPGYHDALRDAHARARHAADHRRDPHNLLPARVATPARGLEPDMLTIGKPIAGGMPAAAYGCHAEVAARVEAAIDVDEADIGGIGGTLAGNALSLAAMRATLAHVLTDEAFARTIPLGDRWPGRAGSSTRPGCLARDARSAVGPSTAFPRSPPRNGGEAARRDHELDRTCTSPRSTGRADDAVPQHGADVAGHDRGGRRPPHRGVRGGGRRATGRLSTGATRRARP